MKRALIVTGGRTDTAFGRRYQKAHTFDFLIAVDSGMQFFFDTKQKPDWIIGDFDSVREDTLQYFKEQEGIGQTRLVPEKDDTDTEAAIRFAIAQDCKEIHILGATGSRIDHMLGNVGLLWIGILEGISIVLADPQNRIRMIDNSLALSKKEQYGDFVSLLAATPEVKGVTLTGMKYPLTDAVMRCGSSLGISNEIIGDTAQIHLKEGVLLVIESSDG